MDLATGSTARSSVPTAWHRAAYRHLQVVGVPVIDATRAQVTADLVDCTLAPFERSHVLCFLNAHGCNFTFHDRAYVRALENATWVVNDGVGMDIAAMLQGRSFTENLNGSDLVDEGDFLRQCAGHGIRVFLLGARQATLDLAVQRYKERFPGLMIAGSHHGYFDHLDDACSLPIVGRINRTGAEVLLVGLGNPLQEIWLDRYRSRLTCRIALACGGSLDQVAGVVPRAPRGWIRLRLEWLYRLGQEPRRLWRRYLIGNALFLVRVVSGRRGLYGRLDGAS
jgi:exopolysaccharide biosynthesis WecB/TagA/CpsF family protein